MALGVPVAGTGTVALGAPATAAAAAGRITGAVRLADAVRAQATPGATLYVYARAVDGTRVPLAVHRAAATGMPARFRLDDGSAMSPQTRLSQHAQVTLGARLSASGSATPQSGDLTGTLGPVAVGSRDLVLTIDGVVP
jgi:cytochrome c-type biogenesis protein CcmH